MHYYRYVLLFRFCFGGLMIATDLYLSWEDLHDTRLSNAGFSNQILLIILANYFLPLKCISRAQPVWEFLLTCYVYTIITMLYLLQVLIGTYHCMDVLNTNHAYKHYSSYCICFVLHIIRLINY